MEKTIDCNRPDFSIFEEKRWNEEAANPILRIIINAVVRFTSNGRRYSILKGLNKSNVTESAVFIPKEDENEYQMLSPRIKFCISILILEMYISKESPTKIAYFSTRNNPEMVNNIPASMQPARNEIT